jgi:hypothetical protein
MAVYGVCQLLPWAYNSVITVVPLYVSWWRKALSSPSSLTSAEMRCARLLYK